MEPRHETIRRLKRCPACGAVFECCAGDCWCDAVALSGEARNTLAQRYADCLCPACLRGCVDTEAVKD